MVINPHMHRKLPISFVLLIPNASRQPDIIRHFRKVIETKFKKKRKNNVKTTETMQGGENYFWEEQNYF